MLLSAQDNFLSYSYQGKTLKNRCGVGRGGVCHVFELPDWGPTHTHTLQERAIFPHLHRPSCKVYNLIPGPQRYKRAEDPGLFSLQSLSLLIRETQTLEDNSRLGSVKERWSKRQILKEEWKERTGRDRWTDGAKVGESENDRIV